MMKIGERREQQRLALIEAAERAIAAKGTAGLKARELASEIGVALGAIYNLVDDLDELALRVAGRTLRRLDEALSAAARRAPALSAIDQLVAVAVAYRRFASDNLHLWRTLFEHRMAPGRPVPDWALGDQMALFNHILAPLRALRPDLDAPAHFRLSQTLFGAVHGVVWLGLEEKFVGLPPAELDVQIEALTRMICAGLAGTNC